jgi:arylsulfatase A-like enzyme
VFNHRHTLRDASTHVPFIVRPAGGVAPVRVSTPVALLDVAPTLLDMVGATPPPEMIGRSLVPCFTGTCAEGSRTYAEGAAGQIAYTDGTWRLEVSGMAPTDPGFDAALRSGEGLHFALWTTADGEQVDHAAEPDKAPILARLVEGMVKARGNRS